MPRRRAVGQAIRRSVEACDAALCAELPPLADEAEEHEARLRYSSAARGHAAAPVPPEVPQLPESAVERPHLMAALKQRVLAGGGGGATAVTAPPKKGGARGNTVAANGMGAALGQRRL